LTPQEVPDAGTAAKHETRRAPKIPDAIRRIAERIHARHPNGRRDIGVGQAAQKLREILRHQRIPTSESR